MFFNLYSAPPPFMEASSPSSPEFEFWVVGKHASSPNHQFLSADELFVDGVLLPLHHLPLGPKPEPELSSSSSATLSAAASISSSAAAPSSGSKRWKDFFKPAGDKKPDDKERKKEVRKTAAELNINIWPFSRSRSAGNSGRPRSTAATSGRKASSAPCSRSNSRSEPSKPATSSSAGRGATTRRWAASPGRAGLSGGVHVGRTSPVWQLRPAAGRVAADKAKANKKTTGGGGTARVLSFNVNTCIGYRASVSCRCDGNATAGAGDHRAGTSSGGHFNIRSLFSKKVY